MASSLNGLTVGESLPENLVDSPATSEGMGYLRDEVTSQYSPMSEDSDDSRYYETSMNASMADTMGTPSSPHRQQRSHGFSSPSTSNSYPLLGGSLAAASCSQPRQRGSDSEGRFPSSPSDICHSADLRRAALLRSVQMRAQPMGPTTFEMPYSTSQESIHNIDESEDRPCSYLKPLIDEREFRDTERIPGMLLLDDCSMGLPESERRSEKCYSIPHFSLKDDDSREVFEGNALEGGGVSSRRPESRGKASDIKAK